MKKSASILDYSYPFLDPAVWDHEQKLYSYHKDFILRLLNRMYENYKLKQPEAWITDIRIIGSLTTSKWLFTSDMDVHMVVNLTKFIELNMPGTDPKTAYEYLDSTRKEFDRAKILAPMTQHPIEYYFEVPEFITTNTSVVGVYSLTQDAWLKDPVIFDADVDFEESKRQVMTQAEAIAGTLDGSFGKIDRQVDRIVELERMIGAWDQTKQQLFYNKIEEKLKAIEAEILKDLELRQALIDARHAAQDPMADIEIKFKWLQRFGFFGILTNLKNLMTETGGQITLQELPLIKKIVTDSSLKEAFLKEAFEKETETDICIDLDKTIAKPAKFPDIGEPIEGAKEALEKIQALGYNVIIYSCRSDDEGGIDLIKEYLDKHDIPYDSIFEGNKPFAKFYIDDRAIKFDNWDSVLKQVEKSEKKASLCIIASDWPEAAWIAPDGQIYDAKPTHDTWMTANVDLLQQKYNFDMSRWINNDDDMYDAVYALIKTGWSRLSIAPDRSSYMVEVASIRSIPQAVFDVLINSPVSKFYIEETNGPTSVELSKDELMQGQSGVNKALQRKRMQGKLFSKKDIIAQTRKVKQGDYSCVMALVPHELAQEIVAWGVRNVPDEDLYLDGDKFGRELESHVTIKYGLLTDDGKYVRRSFNHSKPFKAKLGKVRHFQPPELPFDVLTVEVISDDLQKANEMICDKFECAEGLPSDEYKPHITIAYMKRDTAKEYIGADEFEGKDIILDTVIFSPNKGNRTYFSIGTDKESAFLLEKINKFASWDAPGYWVDPKGNIFDSHGEGLVHNEWVLANLEMLQNQYGIKIPKDLLQSREDYFETLKVDDGDNIDMPASDEVWIQMLASGWVRIGDADDGVGVELNNLRAIPSFLDSILAQELHDGMYVKVEDINHNFVDVEYPWRNLQQAVNRALGGQPKKKADFLPSLFQAPDNKWQEAEGGDDKEIALNPDSVSDETTWDAPCTEGKPRTKEVWRQFISMFSNLFSKNDTSKIESALEGDLITVGTYNAGKYGKFPIEVPQDLLDKYFSIVIYFKQLLKSDPDGKAIERLDSERTKVHNALMTFAFQRIVGTDKKPEDFISAAGDIRHQISEFIEAMVPRADLPKQSAYDPKLEEIEKQELGEDQTAHEYSKDFKDLNGKGKPHNTTWDSLVQDGEPSKPTSVTYSPQISNEDNLDQNSPGGYPRRFMGKPKGEWFSNEGEVNNTLIQMLRNRTATIEAMTIDITKEAFLQHGYWIDPAGKVFEVRGAGEFDDNDYTHWQWISDNETMLKKDYGIKIDHENLTQSLVNAGWTRIGDSSDAQQWQVQVTDLRAIPKAVDNVLAQFVPAGAAIDFADNNNNFVTLKWPWKNSQTAVNRALRQPVAASLKQAGITKRYAIYVNGVAYPAARTLTHEKAIRIVKERFPEAYAKGRYEIREEEFKTSSLKEAGNIIRLTNSNGYELRIFKNPTRQQAINLLYDSHQKEIRYLGYEGTIYIWDAYLAEHLTVTRALGLPDEAAFADVELISEEQFSDFFPLKKKAGSQSASVPDYLIDEWKTEQIMNDTDEEPYVNHDQRDYPYGMHDSPENTDSGIGWPKDNQPSVVHLDTLENPAFRLDPFGIGEYHITYYNAMPMSDGMEATNPE